MEENMNNQINEAPQAYVKSPSKKSSKKMIVIAVAAVVLVVAILIAVFAIGGKNDSTANTEDTERQERIREVEFGFAKGAYENLNSVAKTASKIMDSVYNAWYFAIYEADDYWQEQKASAFASKTGVKYQEVLDAMEKMGYLENWYFTALEDFSSAVWIIIEIYETNEVITAADEDMEYVKAMLQKISSENYEYTKHSELTAYYSSVLSYYEFAKSPSGTLNNLYSTMNSYEAQINTYKNQLSITFK